LFDKIISPDQALLNLNILSKIEKSVSRKIIFNTLKCNIKEQNAPAQSICILTGRKQNKMLLMGQFLTNAGKCLPFNTKKTAEVG
jgi:hypothetical protein